MTDKTPLDRLLDECGYTGPVKVETITLTPRLRAPARIAKKTQPRRPIRKKDDR